MCYELYLSTDGGEDIAKYNSALVHFEHPEGLDKEIAAILPNSAKWYVGSESACSCIFRHAAEKDTEFREPAEWFPEKDYEIRATTELYRAIAALVHAGHQVDCLDVWSGTEQRRIKTISVSLGTVSDKAFRLFENHHFVFEP